MIAEFRLTTHLMSTGETIQPDGFVVTHSLQFSSWEVHNVPVSSCSK